jgi:NADH:ubiquinone oxidoreductase subunit 5 (subunit L)/multisubunit Na+/H+ antiporter MnhA subunit
VYLTVPNANKTSYLNIHSENLIVIIPLSILAIFAIFLGFVASDFVGIGSDFFQNSLFYHPSQVHIIEAEFSIPLYIKLLPTILSLLGVFLAIAVYHFFSRFLTGLTWDLPLLVGPASAQQASTASHVATAPTIRQQKLPGEGSFLSHFPPSQSAKNINIQPNAFISDKIITFNNTVQNINKSKTLFISIYTFLNGKYLLDILYNNYFISASLKLGFTISKILDKGIIELIGPFGLTEGSYSASNNLSKLDTGVITTYALYITLGLISILLILFSPFFFDLLWIQPNSFATHTNNEVTNIIANTDSIAAPQIKVLLLSIFTVLFLFY